MKFSAFSIPIALLLMVALFGPNAASGQQSGGNIEAAPPKLNSLALNNSRAVIAAFNDLCVATFPDKNNFLSGMALNSYGFTANHTAKLPHRWKSGSANLVYADEAMMRSNAQPAPQCILDAVISTNDDHLALARQIESVLLIDDGESKGRGGVNRTIWNYYDEAGNQLRAFLQTRPSKSGNLLLRLTLLRIAQADNISPENENDDNLTNPPLTDENEVSL
jgi:hypothetical protein